MPIYEYQCQECHHEFERLQKISDDPLLDCPECEKPTLKKKISAAGFRLSGGGWYETDFKNSGKKKNLAGDTKSDSSKESKNDSSKESKADSAKSEAKPAKKAESKSD